MSDAAQVSVVEVGGFGDLAEAVAAAMERAGLGGVIPRGAKVLVKPNFHGGEGYTSPGVVGAVVRWARAAGAGEVVVGEGPFFGMTGVAEYFERIGASRLCDDLGVRLENLHDGGYRVFETGLPALPPELGVSEWFDWADVVVNLPVMKTHFNTLTTLATKNLKGLLRPEDKRDLHKRDLHLAIAAIASLIRPQVNLLDATVAYEGMGPSSGTPVELGLLVASGSVFYLDAVANWLMGFEPTQVRYLREAERLGLGEMPATDAAVAALTADPEGLPRLRRRLKRPYETAAEDYPDLRITADLACSGCLMNLFTALAELRGAGRFSPRGHVALGRVADEDAPDLALGVCTFSAWDRCEPVMGCPPSLEAMKEALRAKLAGEGVS